MALQRAHDLFAVKGATGHVGNVLARELVARGILRAYVDGGYNFMDVRDVAVGILAAAPWRTPYAGSAAPAASPSAQSAEVRWRPVGEEGPAQDRLNRHGTEVPGVAALNAVISHHPQLALGDVDGSL